MRGVKDVLQRLSLTFAPSKDFAEQEELTPSMVGIRRLGKITLYLHCTTR